jgi:hypothetical protein
MKSNWHLYVHCSSTSSISKRQFVGTLETISKLGAKAAG